MVEVARSLLFVPGNRPERFDKASASGAHEVILDLEDAVAPAEKTTARDAVAAWLDGRRRALVRINAAQTEWFEDDIRLIQSMPSVGVMLPKADNESLTRTIAALPGCRIIALLETVQGYIDLRSMAAMPGLERIAFGSVDFAAESGISDEGDAMTPVRIQIVLESCHAGLAAPADGVSVNFTDQDRMRQDARISRQLGFGGKLCIHPAQVGAVNAAFLPSADEIQWAERVVAAFAASAGGATSVDGKMIDKPVVDRARRMIAEFTGASLA
jgi:citrate lyase subunit beta/citryl-CoA lyase